MKRENNNLESKASLKGPPRGGSPRVYTDSPNPGDDRDIVFEATSESVLIRILANKVGWAHAPRFKKTVDGFMADGIHNFSIDCKACSHMDSTFMGCLAMLSIALQKSNHTKPNLLNSNQLVRRELEEVGILKLFNESEQELSPGPKGRET